MEQAATPRAAATVVLEAMEGALSGLRQEPRPQPVAWVQPAATSMPVELGVVATVEQAETLPWTATHKRRQPAETAAMAEQVAARVRPVEQVEQQESELPSAEEAL